MIGKGLETSKIEAILAAGGIGVMPTDTIYGLVARALDQKAVARVYAARRRNPKKPMIVLIGDPVQLEAFGIRASAAAMRILKEAWPGAVSVVMPVDGFAHLHRGTKTIAFRLPRPRWLRDMLMRTGPLIAPSANFEGEPPAETIPAARKYFKKSVDFYLDGGRCAGRPSTLIRIERGKAVVLRQGRKRIRGAVNEV